MKARLLLLSCLCSVNTALYAANIGVVNPNFDTQQLNDGTFVVDTISGWQVTAGDTGTYNPPSGSFLGEDGNGAHENTLYLNGGAIVSQTLSDNLSSEHDYTLSFQVGNRFDLDLANYTVRVKSGGITIHEAVNPKTPATNGTFTHVELKFSSTNNSGSPIILELEASGTGQVNFDNFSLTSNPTLGGQPVFGDWKHTSLGDSFSINTTYFAETDGIITYRNDVKCAGNVDVILVGDVSNNLNIQTVRADGFAGMTSPVRKNMYWRIKRHVSAGNCPVKIGFLPLTH